MTKKTFASFEQQIQHLEDKGIIISDRAYTEVMLKQIGYQLRGIRDCLNTTYGELLEPDE